MDNLAFSQQLESKLLEYSKKISKFIKEIPKDRQNLEYIDQVNRSSCSIGANYIEANEAESKKDFFHRIKICRKESKETRYWLEVIKYTNPELTAQTDPLIFEVGGYVKLFSSIISKSTFN